MISDLIGALMKRSPCLSKLSWAKGKRSNKQSQISFHPRNIWYTRTGLVVGDSKIRAAFLFMILDLDWLTEAKIS
jgi:hypothetical protein